MIACRRAIRRTPTASAIVTTAGSPSGTAATARLMPASAASPSGKPRTAATTASSDGGDARSQPVITRPKRARSRVSGVSSGLTASSSVEMRPSSVLAPVATVTPRPLPAATTVPAYSTLRRSASGASAATGRDVLVDRLGLAGERGLLRAQRRGVEQPQVGRDAVALRDLDQVAGHDLLGRDLDPRAVAAHARGLGDELGQRGDRAPGAVLLREPDQRVEDHDREHDEPVLDLAERERQAAGGEQRPHQRRAHLIEQEPRGRRAGRFRQPVGPEARQALLRLRGAQAVRARRRARRPPPARGSRAMASGRVLTLATLRTSAQRRRRSRGGRPRAPGSDLPARRGG